MATALTGQEPLYIVINTGSGHNNASAAQDTIVSILAAAGRRFELMSVDSGLQLPATAHRAVELAQDNGGVVVAVGGDGTINAVSQAVLGSGLPFGIVPQGTFNYFGRTFGISQDTETATRCLLDAAIEPVQVGLLNDKVFLVNASLGLYPQLLEDRETFKQRYGRSRLVAFWSAMATFLRAYQRLALQLDHGGKTEILRTASIVVGNNALQLEQIGIDETAELERDRLVAVTARPMSTLALYGLVLRGLMSRLGEAENISSFGFSRMTVRLARGHRRIKVAVDGEVSWMQQPLEFRVSEHKLPLLVPRDPALRERS